MLFGENGSHKAKGRSHKEATYELFFLLSTLQTVLRYRVSILAFLGYPMSLRNRWCFLGEDMAGSSFSV